MRIPFVFGLLFGWLCSGAFSSPEIQCKSPEALPTARKIAERLITDHEVRLLSCSGWEVLAPKEAGDRKTILLGIPKEGASEAETDRLLEVLQKVRDLSGKHGVGLSLRHSLLKNLIDSPDYAKSFFRKLEVILGFTDGGITNLDLGVELEPGDLRDSPYGINREYHYGPTITIHKTGADFDEDFEVLYASAATKKTVHDVREPMVVPHSRRRESLGAPRGHE